MKLIVTGATGYLGSRLVKRLLEDGNSVGCVIRNVKQLKRLETMRHEVKLISTESMAECFSKFRPDAVLHTACTYSRAEHSDLEVYEGNLHFPFRVLQLAIESGVKKWINTGTCLPEMLNSYSMSKSQLRQWGMFYAGAGKLQFINLQLEHFYGKDAPEDHFLSWVTQKLRNNEPLQLTAGTQHRDFIYIEDVISVFEAVLKRNEVHNYINIPVGTGEAPTIREVVEYLKSVIGSSSELHFGKVPQRFGEPSSYCDTSKMTEFGITKLLNWRTGLKELVKSGVALSE